MGRLPALAISASLKFAHIRMPMIRFARRGTEIQEARQLFSQRPQDTRPRDRVFQLERALNEDSDCEIRSKILNLKWGHLMLKERLKVCGRDPVNQKTPLPAKYQWACSYRRIYSDLAAAVIPLRDTLTAAG